MLFKIAYNYVTDSYILPEQEAVAVINDDGFPTNIRVSGNCVKKEILKEL